MTPFQQRLALKLIEKLRDNMKGYYPAMCRVLLACVGPYVHQAPQLNRTAFNILKDAVYFELQQFPQLAATKPDKIADYLPDDFTYDVATADLIQTYRNGAQAGTKLSMLNLSPVNLVAKKRSQVATAAELFARASATVNFTRNHLPLTMSSYQSDRGYSKNGS